WDLVGRLELLIRVSPSPVIAVSYSPDGRRLAAVGTDRTVRIWDLRFDEPPIRLVDEGEGFSSVAYRPDGRMVATGGGDPPRVIQVPQGKWTPAPGEDRSIRLWDPSKGREIRSLSGHVGPVHALAFHPDG